MGGSVLILGDTMSKMETTRGMRAVQSSRLFLPLDRKSRNLFS